ncbi:phytoene desaturase family protein [Pseudomonas aeruginosa]|uniref:phytoene desaturase family protein n=2 Tax=Pseudomonas aeruginosa TaxID=287 RepID=UPI000B0DDB00|nr:NAD(P)/FAD-dependent oxidoreductase [Pseudomonas aeruginosa]
MSITYDIVAVGSGHNGLVAAAYLAAAGKKVLVLERNAWFGGGVVTRELTVPGFRHDQHSVGHIFIQANPLIRNDELGLLSKYGLKYVYPEVPLISVFEDGSTLSLYRDRQKNYEELAKFSRKDAEAYLKFADIADHYLPMLLGTLYSAPVPMGAQFAMMDQSPEGREMFATMMKSSWEIICEWFSHEKVRLHFARMVGENLASPEELGSGISLFMFLGFMSKYGIGIPVGGSGALTEALIRCIRDHGGEVLSSVDIAKIETRGGRACAVRSHDGRVFEAKDAVIGGIHPHLLRSYLDDAGVAPPPQVFERAERTQTSPCACITIHAALNEKLRFKAGDHVDQAAFIELLAVDLNRFRRSFDDVRYGELPKDPLVALASPTNLDPSRAPAGKATMHAWAYVPFQIGQNAPHYWDEIKEAYAEELLERMKPFFHNLSSDLIIAKHIDTPLDMQRTSPSFQRGDLHGIAGYQHQFGAHRPTPELGRNTVPGVERFYLVGPFQHPGGGVFGAGRATAMKMFDDLKMDFGKFSKVTR